MTGQLMTATKYSAGAAFLASWLIACWSLPSTVQGQGPKMTAAAAWQFSPQIDGQAQSIEHLRFAADGSLLAAWGDDPHIWLIDTQTGDVRHECTAPTKITDLCFGQDGPTIYAIAGGPQQGLICWDVSTGEQTAIPGYTGLLIEAVGPDQLLAVDQRGWHVLALPELSLQAGGDFDHPLLPLWIQPSTGSIVGAETMTGPVGRRHKLVWCDAKGGLTLPIRDCVARPTTACIIPDQDGIVAYSEEGLGGVRLVSLDFTQTLDPEATERRLTVMGQTPITGLAATADGRFLAAVDQGRAVRIWELASRDAIIGLDVGEGRVTSLTVSGASAAVAIIVTDDAGCRVLLFELLDTLRSLAPEPQLDRPVDQWIEQLSRSSAPEAYAAAAWLARNPSKSLPALRRHVAKIVVIPDAGEVTRWIRELDSPDFTRRRSAREALLRVRDLVLPQLEKALGAPHSLDTEISLKQLIYARPSDSDGNSQTLLSGLRLVSTLQMIGDAEAYSLIHKLRAGHPTARVRRAAAAAEGVKAR